MVNQRPHNFSAPSRFGASKNPAPARQQSATVSASPAASRAQQLGLGLGKGKTGIGRGGKGLGKSGLKRHVKIQRDTIYGVTKGDIRRLARRGGVKRISATIYDDVRQALKSRLHDLLKDICAIVDHSGRKTVVVTDVIFTLRRLGNPLYGFDPSYINHR